MTSSILHETQALRDKAWDALTASPAFAPFKALDDAVVSMGGRSKVPRDPSLDLKPPPGAAHVVRQRSRNRSRPSQGDVAFSCLREAAIPLHIQELMEKVIARGIEISGANPLANFRSTLSRDSRFKSIMKDGGYFWWLASSPVPRSWKEAEGPDLLDQPSASNSNNQEGGDTHAATIS